MKPTALAPVAALLLAACSQSYDTSGMVRLGEANLVLTYGQSYDCGIREQVAFVRYPTSEVAFGCWHYNSGQNLVFVSYVNRQQQQRRFAFSPSQIRWTSAQPPATWWTVLAAALAILLLFLVARSRLVAKRLAMVASSVISWNKRAPSGSPQPEMEVAAPANSDESTADLQTSLALEQMPKRPEKMTELLIALFIAFYCFMRLGGFVGYRMNPLLQNKDWQVAYIAGMVIQAGFAVAAIVVSAGYFRDRSGWHLTLMWFMLLCGLTGPLESIFFYFFTPLHFEQAAYMFFTGLLQAIGYAAVALGFRPYLRGLGQP